MHLLIQVLHVILSIGINRKGDYFAMSAIALKKHGNSYGFTIPAQILTELSFGPQDEYELLLNKSSLTILKRRAHHSQWKFTDVQLDSDDKNWMEANLIGVKENE